jgi:hypothetical protein
LGDLERYGRIILKQILERKYDVTVWAGSKWLRTGIS